MKTRRIVPHILVTISLFILFGFAAPVNADITTGLVAHYPFDDGSGSVAHDSSGNGNDGTLVNNPTWISGKIGAGALSFDEESNQYVQLPVAERPSSFTWSDWVRSSGGTGNLQPTMSSAFNLMLTLYFHQPSFTVDGQFYDGAFSNTGLADDQWHNLVGTYSATSGVQSLYVDGSLVATSSSATYVTNNTGPTYVALGAGNFFSGSIDDVRIYDRALAPSDVNALYALGSAPPVISAIASSTTATTATITWTTDENASSTVKYGTTISYGTASTSATLVTSHSISLSGLSASTVYHFQVSSSDSSGNVASSSDYSFTTQPGAAWYVDSGATGLNNGTSWTNAWTDANNLTGVSPGDTVYVSGGPSGSSRTYQLGAPYGQWNLVNGTPENRITYKIGQDSQHDGTAIFESEGDYPGATWIFEPHDVNISGNAGDGEMHFEISQEGSTTIGSIIDTSGQNDVYVGYVDAGNIALAGTSNGSDGIEIDHIYAHISDMNADHAWYGNFSGTTYSDNSFHDSTIYIPGVGPGLGADGLQFEGTGFSIYNNKIIGYSAGYTGGQHQDGWQSLGGGVIKIYNNIFENIGNYAIYGDAYGSAFSNLLIYNNLIVNTNPAIYAGSAGGVIVGTDGGYAGSSPATFSNVIIANNTAVDVSENQSAFALNNATGVNHPTTFDNCFLVNNVDVNSGGIGVSGNASSTVEDNVSLSKEDAPTEFRSYTEFGGISNDLRPLVGAPHLIGQAINLSSYFNTDFDGNTRPSTGAWDIGAYQYATSTPDVTPPVISNIASSTTQTTATISFNTNEAATSTINYGLNTGYGTASSTSIATTTSSYLLSGLSASTLYHFKISAWDAAGNLATSTDQTFTTANPITSPTVTVQAATSVGTSTATLHGTITADGNATSTTVGFTYGLTTSYGATTTIGSSLDTGAFSKALSGLTASTSYHYRAFATNGGGTGISSDQTFTTTSTSTPPLVSGGTPTGTLSSGTTSTTLGVSTDEAATCKYSTSPGSSYGSMTAFGTTGGTTHSTSISGLSNGGSYTYYVKCSDISNNIDPSDYAISFSVASSAPGGGSGSASYVSPTPAGYISPVVTTSSSGATTTPAANLLPVSTPSNPSPASATSAYVFTKNLSYRMSDEDVVRLQEYLTAKGFFTGATDPYFGPLTLRGLVAFQKANGISPASGFFGPVTRAYVNSNAASPTDSVPASSSPAEAPAHSFGENLSYRMEGSEVTALQNYLASKGFLSATANGIFGPQTLKALEGFQSSVGISPASGFFGPVTRSFVNASQ